MAEVITQTIRNTVLSSLKHHPKNPRKGNVEAIAESIERNGFYGVIVAQLSTGYVLAGNHRLMAAKESGMDTVPVAWVECDDATAERILAADNGTSDKASNDAKLLSALLSDIADSSGLEGTGYDDVDLEALVQSLIPPDFKPGAPEDQGRLDQKQPCVCPECGHEWTPTK